MLFICGNNLSKIFHLQSMSIFIAPPAKIVMTNILPTHQSYVCFSYQKIKSALLVVPFLFLYTFFYGQSQQEKREWHAGAGLLFTRALVLDDHFSSLPFKGNAVGANVFVTVKRAGLEQQARLLFSNGKLNATGTNVSVKHLYFTADYTRLYTVGNRDADFVFKLGPQLSLLYSKRDYPDLTNRKKAFEFFGAAGISGMVSYYFSEGLLNGITLCNQLDLPLVFITQQPSYGSQLSEGNLNSENGGSNFFKGSKLQTPGKVLRLKNTVGLEKFWGNKHGISLQYTWDYYQFKNASYLRQATHIAAIAYLLNL